MKKKIYILLLILAISIFAYSGYKVSIYYIDKIDSDNIKDEIKKQAVDIVKEDNEETYVINFDKLKEINDDVIGWITFNNNKVDNVIVKANDNDYYLKRSIYKKKNQFGTIFMDYRNSSFDDQNVLIYGHNMKDRTMFGSLREIEENNFFDNQENNYIIIYSLDGQRLVYQIFSYYTLDNDASYIVTIFKENEFMNYINERKKLSKKKFDVEIKENDKIITLSTCSGNVGTSKRLIVHAKRL